MKIRTNAEITYDIAKKLAKKMIAERYNDIALNDLIRELLYNQFAYDYCDYYRHIEAYQKKHENFKPDFPGAMLLLLKEDMKTDKAKNDE